MSIEPGKVYRTPFEPSGRFRVELIEPAGNGFEATAFGYFVGDHPNGYADGSPGRYFVSELIRSELAALQGKEGK